MEQKRMNVIWKIWWVIYPALLCLAIRFVVGQIFNNIVLRVGIAQGDITPANISDMSYDSPYMKTVYYGITILSGIITIIFGVYFMKRDKKTHGLVNDRFQRNSVLTWVAVTIISFGLIGFSGGITQLTAEYSPTHEQTIEIFAAMGNLYYIIAAVIFAPVMEEIICRGLIFKRLRSFMGFLPSALVSGAIFGVMHGNIVQGIYATVIGVVFAYIYEKKQSLVAPIIAHFLLNGINALSMLFMSEETTQEAAELITGNYPLIITVTIIYAVICTVGILLLKKSSKNTSPWQVKAVAENI
jgi:membrane protease YdiL (CAAX protease family)